MKANMLMINDMGKEFNISNHSISKLSQYYHFISLIGNYEEDKENGEFEEYN